MSQPPVRLGGTLHRNLAANYLGQVYAGTISLLMIPVYLRHFGAEAYGLIAFFSLIQAWVQVLDLGLSAAVAREAARFRAGGVDARTFRHVLRVFEWMFWGSSILLATALASQADAIAHRWLTFQQLTALEVQRSLQCMALAVALGWIPNVYRGLVSGMEQQVWINGFNAVITTLRFVVVVPVTMALGGTVVEFALFQIAVSAVELAGLWWKAAASRPAGDPVRLPEAWALARPALRFATRVGLATVVWIAVTQSDRLVLSTVLPLAEYGFFTAAAGAASVVAMLTFAIAQAFTPRLTAVAHSGSPADLHALYRQATRLATAIGTPLALLLVLAPRELLWVWTGNAGLADRYSGVLALYAAGNGFLLLAGLPYCLQYALGHLRLHVLGNLILGATAVPALLFAATRYGAVGTGWVWLLLNAAWFLCWTPVVHRRFAPGLHLPWLRRDILAVAAPGCVLAALVGLVGLPAIDNRWTGALLLAGVFASLVACSVPALRAMGRPLPQAW